MTSRVRLTWNRNQDEETEFYRVYRSSNFNITPSNRTEHLVMRVEHPKDVNPITIIDEHLDRYSNRTYLMEHKNILVSLGTETFGFHVKVNGVEVFDFSLDTEEGRIIFDQPLDESDEVICSEYTFDGVQVWDYQLEEEGKVYYGPDAKDISEPDPPTNLKLEGEMKRNRIQLSFSSSEAEGSTFYYRIDAAKDSEYYSELTGWKSAKLQEPLAERPYIVERSIDGIEWNQVATIKENIYYEYMIDRHAPDAIRKIDTEVMMFPRESRADIHLKWPKAIDTMFTDSPRYRVRTVNAVGVISKASNTIGPIPFQAPIKEIVIRRKRADGTLPTFSGNDSITVATLSAEETNFIDSVGDNKDYIYGIWVVDYAGNRSAIAHATVTVYDVTPPPVPQIASIRELQLVNG